MARKSPLKWILLASAFIATGTGAAGAQVRYCLEHGALVAQLGENSRTGSLRSAPFGEIAVMEVFVGEKGSWTIIVTDVAGRSCIIAAGDNWENSVILSGENA